jgi:hypothetical protein
MSTSDGDGLDSDQEAQLGHRRRERRQRRRRLRRPLRVAGGHEPEVRAVFAPTGPITLQVAGSDAFRSCAQDTSPTGTGFAVAYAQCAGAVSVTWADAAVGTCPRHIERVWTASDLCSNVVSATQVVVAADSLAP